MRMEEPLIAANGAKPSAAAASMDALDIPKPVKRFMPEPIKATEPAIVSASDFA